MRNWLKQALVAPGVALGLGVLAAGCSLSNVSQTDCNIDDECTAAFGAGSTCKQGFCTEPGGCTTGHDCRKLIGGGACVEGKCVDTFPTDPQCDFANAPPEPPDLFSQKLTGPDAPLVIGSIYRLDFERDQPLTDAVRLAVREINKDGLEGGRKLGVVFCDNGGPGATLSADDRVPLDQRAVDYLAGTLGVPYLVGPLTSGDAIATINRITKQSYPTVVISASSTSPALTGVADRLKPGDPHGLFWRTCPSDEIQGKVLADAVIGPDATILRTTVIYVHDPYGDGLAQSFQDAYGIARMDRVPYDVGAVAVDEAGAPTNPAALAQIAMEADAKGNDAVLIIAHAGEARLILNAMEGLSITTKKFFFTDGSKDVKTFLQPAPPAWLQTILASAVGTAPASPSGSNYTAFATNLQAEFKISASSVSFVAQAYDAAYVGAFATLYASRGGGYFDGLGVAEGLSKLISGTKVNLDGPNAWTAGKGLIVKDGQLDVEGTSGHLQFDPATGEAPAAIEIWEVLPDLTNFTTKKIEETG